MVQERRGILCFTPATFLQVCNFFQQQKTRIMYCFHQKQNKYGLILQIRAERSNFGFYNNDAIGDLVESRFSRMERKLRGQLRSLESGDSEYSTPFENVCENEKREGRMQLKGVKLQGRYFCIFGCLFIGKRSGKAVHINDEKESPIKKIEGSMPNSSDEKEEHSAFSLSDSSASPRQCKHSTEPNQLALAMQTLNSIFSGGWVQRIFFHKRVLL